MPEPITDLEIRKNPMTAQQKEENEDKLPSFISQLELSEKQRKRITTEIIDEFTAIKKERDAEMVDKRLTLLLNQYEGLIEEDEDQQFTISRGLTKEKVDTVVNSISEAQLEPSPKFAISPRPEYYNNTDGDETAEKQEDFLDYKIDEVIPYREPSEQVLHSAVLYGNGIKKFEYVLNIEKRRREEVYKGTPLYTITTTKGLVVQVTTVAEMNKALKVDPEAQVEYANKGLDDFLQAYPTAMEEKKYMGWIEKLHEGKEINIMVEYNETVYNDPMPKCIDLKNFYVRIKTEGNIGLSMTQLIVERQSYSWWELQKLKNKPEYYEDQIEKLKFCRGEDNESIVVIDNYNTETYNILECTFYTKLEESDEDETKCKFWVAEEKELMIGATLYPYDAISCEYVDYHMPKKREGFYQPGLGEYLTDDQISEDAIMNFMLEGLWTANMITPIVRRDSQVVEQFNEKRWTHGVPLESENPNGIRFVNEFLKPIDTGSLLGVINSISQSASNKLGINPGISGKSDPVDPSAPARKTLALIAQSSKNIKAYILAMQPSMNADGKILLGIYYQMSKEGRKYRLRTTKIVGDNPTPFGEISREEMRAATNLQSQAYVFASDKLAEKNENLALLQVLRNEPLIASNPEAVWSLLRAIVGRWSPFWKNNIDKILPDQQELNQQVLQVTVQAIDRYVQMVMQQAQQTGIAPKFDVRELLPMIQQAQRLLVTPPTKEEVKAQKEAQKNGA